ncbi:hypothetical protein CDL12_00404 [Handroanthus impetiginosus]|uniref:Uncharacterized protein n=1 Tax=Handroanthus impetiginosus TaxID=429701 RepID=A0A2G9IAR3_9LAMI|nr:hypothetical protein CDL12_00404 [Handroanthus impetiginosus]
MRFYTLTTFSIINLNLQLNKASKKNISLALLPYLSAKHHLTSQSHNFIKKELKEGFKTIWRRESSQSSPVNSKTLG